MPTATVELEKFSGPLDLLLNLIKENQLDITELALSEITEQYLQYLDKLEHNRDEELADFLVIGTKLLYLKSRLLLPTLVPDNEDEQSLEDQLKLYKIFVEASSKLNKLWGDNNRAVFRIEPPRKSKDFVVPVNLDKDVLYDNIIQLIKRLKPLKPLPETRIDKVISIKERLDKMRNVLKKNKSVNFFEILENSKNRTEVIVSFLALLELVKQKTVMLKQQDSFTDIEIKRV